MNNGKWLKALVIMYMSKERNTSHITCYMLYTYAIYIEFVQSHKHQYMTLHL